MAHDRDDDAPDDLALERLLRDAVADVQPEDRLGEIRRRTAPAPRRSRQRWPLAVLGAGVATAAVVGGVAWVGGWGLGGDDAGPAGTAERQDVVAAYFVDDTPVGARLFREFRAVPPSDDDALRAVAALRLLESGAGPLDPDYRTAWPDDSFTGVTVTDGLIRVGLADRADPLPGDSLPGDPAVQQAVLTVQAALGETLPVAFTTPEGTLEVAGRASVGRDNRLLAPVNITDPVEGHTVDDLLTIRGTVGPALTEGDSPADVTWELRDGGTVVASGSVTPAALAWEQTTPIAEVPSGTYTLVATVATDAGPAEDTRTLTVR